MATTKKPRARQKVKKPLRKVDPEVSLKLAEELGEIDHYDSNDRYVLIFQLKKRGFTLRQIAEKLNISYVTAINDLKKGREALGAASSEFFDSEQFVIETLTGFNDLEANLWNIYNNAIRDKDKLDALNSIRMVTNDKMRTMMDIGVVQKAPERVEHELTAANVGWNEEVKNRAVEALISGLLPANTSIEPTLDPNYEEKQYDEVYDPKEEESKEEYDDSSLESEEDEEDNDYDFWQDDK